MELDLDAVRREVEMYSAAPWSAGSAKVSIAVSLAEGVPALLEYVDKLVRRATLAEARWSVIETELEEERRHCAALREQARNLEDERDRLRDELGAKCEELHGIGQTVTRSGRRLRFDEAGS